MIRVLAIALILSLCACTSYFPPSPTSRAVSTSDLAGTWSYVEFETDGEITLKLLDDQTFQQTVTLPDRELTQEGTWKIDGATIELTGVLEYFTEWTVENAAWRIIDRDESPTGFAILGGAVDPDGWRILRWVP